MLLLWIAIAILFLFGFVVFTGAPYLPTKRDDLRRAFDELYQLDENDVLVDIGSGDGVVLREAASRGARAVGYELNPVLVYISRFLSRGDAKVRTINANFWKVDIPDDSTVVYTFGEARDIAKIAKKVEQQATRLERSLYFISYGFDIRGYELVKKVGAHFLYKIEPLQK